MKEVDWSSFFQRLDTLPRGERASLKREAGTMLSQADGQAMRVFFQCLPFSIPQWQEERAFAAACLYCLQLYEDGFMLKKLSRLIRFVRSKGYAVDCQWLLEDLFYWNGEKQSVQRKWARALYIKPEEQQEELKGE